jgi:RNA polymerase-binding protein DksA
MSHLSQEQLQRFRTILTQRSQALRAEVDALDDARTDALATARDTVEDAGDQAESRRNDEVRNAEEERDGAELREIDAALARLDAGRFGKCIDCGVDIALPRLEARPSAARCIECQERHEKGAPPLDGIRA